MIGGRHEGIRYQHIRGRYVVLSRIGHWLGTDWPLGTIAVNVVGSFLLGAGPAVPTAAWSALPEVRTFLAGRRDFAAAARYIAASVALSIAGLFAGLSMVRTMLA